MRFSIILSVFLLATSTHASDGLKSLCEIIVDEKARVLVSKGRCDAERSPASTFKVTLSLMGFDNGYLKDATAPKLPFKPNYSAYLPEWGRATDPQDWMRYSVVWYSEELVKALGRDQIERYLQRFQYGNGDIHGYKAENFWVGSTLKISGQQQAEFMRRMMMSNLPVSDAAIAKTKQIMKLGQQKNGWMLYGKTGAATPRDVTGKRLTKEKFGWFIGFAEKDGEKIGFAKLVQSDRKEAKSLGLIAKDQMIERYFETLSPL